MSDIYSIGRLTPGTINLFVQGLETDVVLSRFAACPSIPEPTESLVVILTVIVTTPGLLVPCILPYLSFFFNSDRRQSLQTGFFFAPA